MKTDQPRNPPLSPKMQKCFNDKQGAGGVIIVNGEIRFTAEAARQIALPGTLPESEEPSDFD